ncbi:hypothetical protein HCN44_001743 [Aphidius gifuensis]|uniref:Raptor N-terminal CASPase-like domain-containing protein n=1 Tax=Aphidius gifuensis TaxID=684658 RepID=A0A835CSM6_APHGI|nr:hypothetical protein HCN44_001743 [Aphidius gifuensis]
MPIAFNKQRHITNIEGINRLTQSWRMKERVINNFLLFKTSTAARKIHKQMFLLQMKTVSVALVLCLNFGVDPPDIVKTQPCARLESWIDPSAVSPSKALEIIGASLQKQYERWQPRLKKLKNYVHHYNGHGVPKPTSNGEIRVFNRTYTQYIPLPMYDLQTWMGAPSIYVYDCSNAGSIVDSFKQFAKQHEKEYENEKQNRTSNANSTNNGGQQNIGSGGGVGGVGGVGGIGGNCNITMPSYKNCIQLAACAANQILPMNPDLPADIFTSCLTTPIKIALHWFVMQNTSKLVPKISLDLIDKIPGQLSDRRTMLGELNWIFTAITDTIAWNTLPRDLFQKLCRQDLLVASLFRNFLLAERILRSYDCTPVSCLRLPSTYQHPMWQAWDLALDLCLSQLTFVLNNDHEFIHLPFYEEHLTAFEVWLTLGSKTRIPPEQLPIVLQVLLSEAHRLRALKLLGKFLNLGPWTVNLALSVVRDNGHKYFLSVLQDTTMAKAALQGSLVSICLEQLNDSEPMLRMWLCLCLGRLWNNYDKARWCGVRDIAHEKLSQLLNDPIPEVRTACVFALGTFINSVQKRSEHANNIDQIIAMTLINTVTHDMSYLVRKELVVALQWMVLHYENSFVTLAIAEENSRKDLIVETLSPFSGMRRISSRDRLKIGNNYTGGSDTSSDAGSDRLKRVSSSSSISSLGNNWEFVKKPCESLGHSSLGNLPSLSYGSVYMKLWHGLCVLDNDPHPGVANMSQKITTHIRNQIKDYTIQKEVNDTKILSILLVPPSPSNRTNYLNNKNDSPSPPQPPQTTASTLHSTAADILRTTRMLPQINRGRKPIPNTITEEADEAACNKTPLTTSQFVDWSCAQFAQPVSFDNDNNKQMDVESRSHNEREWRYLRNKTLRIDASEEQQRCTNSKIDCQVFHTRCPQQPEVIKFHPFDTHIAVAVKDYFAIWDWNSGNKLTYYPSRGNKLNTKITTIQYINSHDISLLMTGSDDGSIRVWKNYYNTFGREPMLLTAWQGLSDLQPVSKASIASAGLVTSWEQKTLTLAVTGDVRIVRLWDAETELRKQDLPTGADCCSICLDTDGTGSLMVVGCGDGSVRLFDRRLAQNESRIMTWHEHNTLVLDINLQTNNSTRLITGLSSGDVRIFDLRKNSSLNVIHTTPGLSAFCVHPTTNIFACPSKALEIIGASLQKQYERWQPRARYKHSLDSTVEKAKKLCTSLRRNAREERVLFHYNGHGVPKPTSNGEIWVFN